MKRTSVGLVRYPDSSDEEEKPQPSKKRKLPALSSELTLPTPVDDPSKHQGRTRSSPHVEGQWAAYVYVPVTLRDHAQMPLRELVRNSFERAKETVSSLQPMGSPVSGKSGEEPSSVSEQRELHISLTRPFFLRAHQREEVKSSVKAIARAHHSFTASFAAFSELTNDERTRTFVCMEVGAGHEEFRTLADALSPVLRTFRQKQYYESPRFHASFAWALLDPSSNSPTPQTEHAAALDTIIPPDPAPALSVEDPTTSGPTLSLGPASHSIPHFPSTLVPSLNAELSQKLTSKAGIFEVGEVRIRIGQDVFGWGLGG